MRQYPALVDGEPGAYGVAFPDLPGIGAMGYTVAEALAHAEEALSTTPSRRKRTATNSSPPALCRPLRWAPGNGWFPFR